MKKMFMILTVIALGIMFMGTSTVMAGGDQNRGEIGQGSTHENNCEDQPCFDNAPRPGSSDTLLMQSADKTSELDDTEIHHLLFIREEEKLARDVYLTLYRSYEAAIFANISESEQRHMDAVKGLIDKYGLTDPVINDDVGEFTNPVFTALYEELVDKGETSYWCAIQVGIDIEVLDIEDIEFALLNDVEARDVSRVFNNLLNGSYNHLNAFTSRYEGNCEFIEFP